MSLRLFIYFILFSCFACTNQQGIYEAYDYAYVGDYTLGLEGPAVDFSGNLYFVNPLKKEPLVQLIPKMSLVFFRQPSQRECC